MATICAHSVPVTALDTLRKVVSIVEVVCVWILSHGDSEVDFDVDVSVFSCTPTGLKDILNIDIPDTRKRTICRNTRYSFCVDLLIPIFLLPRAGSRPAGRNTSLCGEQHCTITAIVG